MWRAHRLMRCHGAESDRDQKGPRTRHPTDHNTVTPPHPDHHRGAADRRRRVVTFDPGVSDRTWRVD